jgi:NAD-dependent dihydropyrimidine dehydrogenase PreA subunit
MASRTIIEIDQDLCDGCGACETGCPEGALKIIDGKARLAGESLCDGLGACIGHCPRGAIHVTEREAAAYDEIAVMEEILPQGMKVVEAHFAHLDHHGQDLYLEKAAAFLHSKNLPLPKGFERFSPSKATAPAAAFSRPSGGGCPGTLSRSLRPAAPGSASTSTQAAETRAAGTFPDRPSGASTLRNWPIQLHLATPRAPHFAGARLLVAADCTAFSLGSFHRDFIDGKALVIACPKLDSGRDLYVSKLSAMIAQAASVAVVIMEVPCCSGLLKLVQEARAASGSQTPIEVLIAGIDGGFIARNTL